MLDRSAMSLESCGLSRRYQTPAKSLLTGYLVYGWRSQAWFVDSGVGVRRLPITRFVRPESDPQRAVGEGTRFLFGPGVDIFFPCHIEIGESNITDQLFQLCFQQSTGNSPGPEIDVLLCRKRNLAADCDVGNLEPTTGLERPEPLLGHSRFRWHQVEQPVGDNDINRTIGDR